MGSNPVVMARRTAAGMVSHAASRNKDEYELLFRMYMEDMDEREVDRLRSVMLLLSATMGIAAEAGRDDPVWLNLLVTDLAGA